MSVYVMVFKGHLLKINIFIICSHCMKFVARKLGYVTEIVLNLVLNKNAIRTILYFMKSTSLIEHSTVVNVVVEGILRFYEIRS